MKRLVIGLSRSGPTLIGRIVHQDDELRGEHDYVKKIIMEYDGFQVASVASPYIFMGTNLYIGVKDKSLDDRVFFYTYNTEEEAEVALNTFKYMIRKINEMDDDTFTCHGLDVVY